MFFVWRVFCWADHQTFYDDKSTQARGRARDFASEFHKDSALLHFTKTAIRAAEVIGYLSIQTAMKGSRRARAQRMLNSDRGQKNWGRKKRRSSAR
jgi:hypothetical protein